jgi:hypothetical protein
MSYIDTLMVGLHTCADAVPDPDLVARAIEDELAELVRVSAQHVGDEAEASAPQIA